MTRVPPRRFNSLEEFGISTISPTKSFVINHEGVIYEKDLGPTAANTAQLMEAFNPDRRDAEKSIMLFPRLRDSAVKIFCAPSSL